MRLSIPQEAADSFFAPKLLGTILLYNVRSVACRQMKSEKELKRLRIVSEHRLQPSLSNKKLAKKLKCSPTTVRKRLLDAEQGGDGKAKKQTGRPRALNKNMTAEVTKRALYLAVSRSPEIACHLKRKFGVTLSARTVSRALKRAREDILLIPRP